MCKKIENLVNITPKMMDLQEVCDFFKISRRTLYAKIQEGTFPPPLGIFERKQLWLNLDLYEMIDEYRLAV